MTCLRYWEICLFCFSQFSSNSIYGRYHFHFLLFYVVCAVCYRKLHVWNAFTLIEKKIILFKQRKTIYTDDGVFLPDWKVCSPAKHPWLLFWTDMFKQTWLLFWIHRKGRRLGYTRYKTVRTWASQRGKGHFWPTVFLSIAKTTTTGNSQNIDDT